MNNYFVQELKIVERTVNKDFLKLSPLWDWTTYRVSSSEGTMPLSMEPYSINETEQITNLF